MWKTFTTAMKQTQNKIPEIVSRAYFAFPHLQGHIEFVFHEDACIQCCVQVCFMWHESPPIHEMFIYRDTFQSRSNPPLEQNRSNYIKLKDIKYTITQIFSCNCIHTNTLWKETLTPNKKKLRNEILWLQFAPLRFDLIENQPVW